MCKHYGKLFGSNMLVFPTALAAQSKGDCVKVVDVLKNYSDMLTHTYACTQNKRNKKAEYKPAHTHGLRKQLAKLLI